MLSSVADALAAWEKAPLHVRTMAGAYVGPLLAALVEIDSRQDRLEKGLEEAALRIAYMGGPING